MAQYKYAYTVDELQGPVVASMGPLYYDDVYGNIIYLTVLRGKTPSDLTTGTITGTAIRADGGTITLTGQVSTGNNNECLIGLTAQCYKVPGPLQVYVRWNGGSGVKTTLFAGVGNVMLTDSGVIGSTVVTQTVTSLISAINAATATIPSSYSDLEGMIAPNYNGTSKIYKKGEYVRYEDNLYRRLTDATAVEATFVSANWQSVSVGITAVTGAGYLNAVSDLPDANNAISNRIHGISISQSASSQVEHLPYPQANGTLFTIGPTLEGGYGAVQLFFAVSASRGYPIYKRIKTLSDGEYVWSDWVQLSTGALCYTDAALTSFSAAEPNRIYTITGTNLTAQPIAAPGTLVTYGTTQNMVQTFYAVQNGAVRVFNRCAYLMSLNPPTVGFTDWKETAAAPQAVQREDDLYNLVL